MPSLGDLFACRDYSVFSLRDLGERDWSIDVPDLDFTVSQLVAHLSQANFWYAIDLSARGVDLDVIVPEIKTDGAAADLISSIEVGVELLTAVVAATPDEARGFHPLGQADASGFAAMACDEMLIHSYDIARAFGRDFEPPGDLAVRVLARLFPWADDTVEPWPALLHANGRIDLGDRPRLERWRWHCAPLSEWDGTTPE